MVQGVEPDIIFIFKNLAQFSGESFFCLHIEETNRSKVGVADSCLLKAGPTVVLNHIIRRLGGARIGVQVFVFFLSVYKKKLTMAKIRVLLGIVHILCDTILCRT